MRRLAPLFAVLLLPAAGCHGPGPAEPAAPITRAEVQAILDAQRRAWNAGDLAAFMAGYERSEALSFVGGSGLTRGFDATLARYRASYPDDAARGVLDFELIEVRPLAAAGGRVAVAIGRWHLQRAEPTSGWFTLVLARRGEAVRIVHDHSSATPQPTAAMRFRPHRRLVTIGNSRPVSRATPASRLRPEDRSP